MRISAKKNLTWDGEAAALLRKVPFVVRRLAQSRVEDVERARRGFFKEVERQAEPKKTVGSDSSRPVLYQVDACKGQALGCPFGLVDTQRLAERVTAVLEELRISDVLLARIEGLLLPHHKLKVAIAGCPNSCTQSQIKDFGIIAQALPARGEAACTGCGLCVESCQEGAILLNEDGPSIDAGRCVRCGLCARVCPQGTIRQQEGVRLLVGGRLGRHPRLGLEIASFAAEEEVIRAIGSLLEEFRASGQPHERFSHFIEERFFPDDGSSSQRFLRSPR